MASMAYTFVEFYRGGRIIINVGGVDGPDLAAIAALYASPSTWRWGFGRWARRRRDLGVAAGGGRRIAGGTTGRMLGRRCC